MIEPKTIDQLLADEPISRMQSAIVKALDQLFPNVTVKRHPGRVDISELVGKSVVSAPGIGIGFSATKRASVIDGSHSAVINWTAYIVTEAKSISNRRVEKEQIGFAIGNQLLAILSDVDHNTWGLKGVEPPELSAPIELKPLFTTTDQTNNIAYYTVTWPQAIIDIGNSNFQGFKDKVQNDGEEIIANNEDDIALIKQIIKVAEDNDDA